MAVYNEGNNIGDIVKMESNYSYSRETVTLKQSTGVYVIGTLLAVETSTTKYRFCVQTGADNTAVPAGILLQGADTTFADVKVIILKRGPADINANKIVFDSSFTTQTQKDTALNLLKNGNAPITWHRGA